MVKSDCKHRLSKPFEAMLVGVMVATTGPETEIAIPSGISRSEDCFLSDLVLLLKKVGIAFVRRLDVRVLTGPRHEGQDPPQGCLCPREDQ